MRIKSTGVGLFIVTLFVLFMSFAAPAHAQSLEDQAVEPHQTTEVSYVQAPVVREPTITPRVSFQAMGSSDWHMYVDANLHAYHFDRQAVKEYHFNENNLGVGLEWVRGDVWRIMVGQYHNSIWRNATYFLAGYTPLAVAITDKDHVNIGVVAGALSGYTENAQVQVPYTITDPVRGFQYTRYKTETVQKPRGFMPAAGVLVSYEHDNKFGLNLIFVPNLRRAGVYGFMGIQARIGIPDNWW